MAATLAVEQANRAGGYKGIPFRLVASWSENPWGSGVKDVTRLVYEEQVWAIVGAPDGPSAHLVEQIVAKARLVFISTVSTDKTANLANVPWIISCAPGDHILAARLAEVFVGQVGQKNFTVASCTDHDSRMFTKELLIALNKFRVFPARHLHFRPGSDDFGGQLQDIRRTQPAAVVLIAGPRDAAVFLTALRREGVTVPVFGGPRMGRRLFAEIAGKEADGVWFPRLAEKGMGTIAMVPVPFSRFEPDYAATYTYDGMMLLIDAIRQAGLNRVRICDAVREKMGRAPLIWGGGTCAPSPN